ncbi:endoribonuclease L-PSP [Colletotrichum asianum]
MFADVAQQGYRRAIWTGNQVHVSGTTANLLVAELPNLGGNLALSQTVWSLDTIQKRSEGIRLLDERLGENKDYGTEFRLVELPDGQCAAKALFSKHASGY